MPDYSLSDLKDYAVTLDVLQRMGDAAADAGFDATFSMWPGQSPVVRLKQLCVPLGVPGIGDPVGSVVPSGRNQDAAPIDDFLSMRSDFKHPTVVASSSPATDPDGLPGAAEAGQAADPSPFDAPNWTDAELDELTEVAAVARVSGQRGTLKEALEQFAAKHNRTVKAVTMAENTRVKDRVAARVAALKPTAVAVSLRPDAWSAEDDARLVELVAEGVAKGVTVSAAAKAVAGQFGRGAEGVKFRCMNKLKARIAARVAELTQQKTEMLGGEPGGLQRHLLAENAPVQGVAGACDGVAAAAPEAQPVEDASPQGTSPALEQAGEGAAVSQPLPAAQSAHVPAPADDAPAETAQVVELVAEVAKPPLPRPPSDALTDHLLRPLTRRGRRLADDLALAEMLIAKMPIGLIASELGMQPHEVTACNDRLTGYNAQTKARVYGLPEVEARLRILVAHDQQTAA